MQLSRALLGLLLACDFTAPSSQASAPDSTEEPRRPYVDRGLILSRPATQLLEEPDIVLSDDPPPEEPRPDVASTEGLEAEVQARLPDHRLACARVKRLPCKAVGDLDGDGATDIVALVEPAGRRSLGLAILWGRGGVDLLGAGRRGQRWLVQSDGPSERELIPADLSTLARWSVWSADGPAGKPHGFVDPRKRHFRAPSVRGDGILLDGGDSATIAYHDGKGWRLHYLGF